MSDHEKITFYSNNLRLFGELHKPEVDKHTSTRYPVVVILHGSHQGEASHSIYSHLKMMLPTQGIGVFVYDRRGSGQSEGNFETASFHELAEDALAAVKMLRNRDDIDKHHIGMYGISQGGWIAPLAASISEDVSFLILVSASGVPPSKQMLYAAAISLREAGFSEEIVTEAVALKKQVDDYFRGYTEREAVEPILKKSQDTDWYSKASLPSNGELPVDVKKSKWFYQLDYDPWECILKVNVPILFMFADHDIYVPVEESIKAYDHSTSKNPKVNFITIENADHFMVSTKEIDAYYQVAEDYLTELVDWIRVTCNHL